jgi:hypothetical protein
MPEYPVVGFDEPAGKDKDRHGQNQLSEHHRRGKPV